MHTGAAGPGTGVGQHGSIDMRGPCAPATTGRAVCFSDVHGNIEELRALWEHVRTDLGREAETATLVFLGDYCDRGRLHV